MNWFNTIIPPASIAKKPWETLVMQIGSLGSRPTNTGHENTRLAAPPSLQTSSSEQGHGRSWRRVTPAGTFHDQRRPGLGLLLLLREMSCVESGQLRNKQIQTSLVLPDLLKEALRSRMWESLSSQFACLQSMLNAKLLKLYTARVNHSSADPVKLHLGWTCGTCCIWMSKKPIESFTEAVPSNTCTMVKGHHTSHTLTHVPFKPWPWQVLRHADLHWGEEGVILAFSHESLQTALVVARTRTCSKQSQSDSTFKVWRYAG